MSSSVIFNNNDTGASAPSAFHSIPSASSEGAQPPPTHPAVKKSPPGASRRFDKEQSHSSSPSDDEDEDQSRPIGDHSGDKSFDWPAHSAYDERRQLIGTEEESSERPSSDEEEDKNPWHITSEQLNYYTTQFFSMQSNPRGVIPGELAKEFFEKSRLPIAELRKIWLLSDVSKDGCLSLEEFLTAMHLVVLRRNAIDLPDTLPTSLQPMTLRGKLAIDKRHNKDLYQKQGDGGDHLLLNEESANRSEVDGNDSRDSRNSIQTPNSITSPGPKPVNFDFHDARMNPHIIQPVALRLSPESPVVGTTSDDEEHKARASGAAPSGLAGPVNVKQGRREVVYEQLWNQDDGILSTEESLSSMTLIGDGASSTLATTSSRTVRRSAENTTDEEDLDEEGCSTEIDGLQDLSPSPPSLPNDKSGVTSSLPHFSNALYKNQQKSPPLPPPRPGPVKSHARSSSLDLNNLRPPVPPRNCDPIKTVGEERVIVGSNRDSRTIQMRIHQYREKNSVIARTINELHQEVSDTLEERIALEFHLEQLKSFGD